MVARYPEDLAEAFCRYREDFVQVLNMFANCELVRIEFIRGSWAGQPTISGQNQSIAWLWRQLLERFPVTLVRNVQVGYGVERHGLLVKECPVSQLQGSGRIFRVQCKADWVRERCCGVWSIEGMKSRSLYATGIWRYVHQLKEGVSVSTKDDDYVSISSNAWPVIGG